MKRSAFLAVLASLPLVGSLFKPHVHEWVFLNDRVASKCYGCGLTVEYMTQRLGPPYRGQVMFAEIYHRQREHPHGEYPFKSITARPS